MWLPVPRVTIVDASAAGRLHQKEVGRCRWYPGVRRPVRAFAFRKALNQVPDARVDHLASLPKVTRPRNAKVQPPRRPPHAPDAVRSLDAETRDAPVSLEHRRVEPHLHNPGRPPQRTQQQARPRALGSCLVHCLSPNRIVH